MIDIDKLLKSYFKYFSQVSINLMPGIFILEIVFNKGFFSSKIISWIDLIFYFLWAVIFSLPFHINEPRNFKLILKSFYKSEFKKNKNARYKKLIDASYDFELKFIMLKIFVFYILFNLITWQTCIVIPSIFHIKAHVGNFIISLFITCALGSVIAWIYRKIICFSKAKFL